MAKSKELTLQKGVVDAVIRGGGMGLKLSNRFLVGVPDLLLKTARGNACIVEVKQRDALVSRDEFVPDVTMQQKRSLIRWADAGLECGVLSFVRDGKSWRAALYRWETGRTMEFVQSAFMRDHFLVDKDFGNVVQCIEAMSLGETTWPKR